VRRLTGKHEQDKRKGDAARCIQKGRTTNGAWGVGVVKPWRGAAKPITRKKIRGRRSPGEAPGTGPSTAVELWGFADKTYQDGEKKQAGGGGAVQDNGCSQDEKLPG